MRRPRSPGASFRPAGPDAIALLGPIPLDARDVARDGIARAALTAARSLPAVIASREAIFPTDVDEHARLSQAVASLARRTAEAATRSVGASTLARSPRRPELVEAIPY